MCYNRMVRLSNPTVVGDHKGPRLAVTPEAIVDAAARIVDCEGIDALTLSRVAAELQVSQPAMYKHVAGVEEVLRRLALRARHLLAERLRHAAVGRSGDRAVEAVAAAWRAFVKEHPGLYAATDRHPLAGFTDLEEAVADIISILGQIVAGYGMAEEDAEHGAWSLRSAIHGFVVLEAEQGHPGPLDLDESFARLIRLMCGGLRDMAGAPPTGRPGRTRRSSR